MTRMLPVLTILVVVLAGCDGEPVRPTPLPVYVPPVRAMSAGEELKDTFGGAELVFEVTAPTQGTLVVRLAWDPLATDSLLELVIGDTRFLFSEPDASPIVGRVSASAGQRYLVRVAPGGTGMWYDVPFVLTTWME